MKGHGLSADTIHRIAETVAHFPNVNAACLFGSRAKGCAKPGSDVDLALYGDQLTDDTCEVIHQILEEETNLPYFFDVVNYQTITRPEFREHIDRVAVEIYRAS